MVKSLYPILSLVIVVGLIIYPVLTLAVSRGDLQEQIEDKNQELEDLSGQIQQTQSTITNLQGQGASLQAAIRSINAQIDQASYGIRTSEVSIDKLALELESLGYDLDDVTQEISVKQAAVSEVLRKVQQKDDEGILEILLKNETLADSVFEIQSLQDLQSNLSLSVAQLTGLQYRLGENIDTTNTKKGDLEDENLTLKSRKVILSGQKLLYFPLRHLLGRLLMALAISLMKSQILPSKFMNAPASSLPESITYLRESKKETNRSKSGSIKSESILIIIHRKY